jgi:molecular chaperone GrpE (heat shock protein)
MSTDEPGEGMADRLGNRADRILAGLDFNAAIEARDAHLSSLLDGLIEVLDSLDRALAGAAYDAVPASSCRLIVRQVEALLERTGVQSPTCVGEPVDLSRDEIIETQPSEHADGIVLEVVARSYVWDGRLLRHARVVVANNEEGAGT